MKIKKGEGNQYIEIEESHSYEAMKNVAKVTVKNGDQKATIEVSIKFLAKVVAALTTCYFIFSSL